MKENYHAYRNGIKKGSKITVKPIRKTKDIKSISRLLKYRPLDYLLWILGINNGLRAKDLVRLRYNQMEGLKTGAAIKIVETKTGKDNVLVINKADMQKHILEIIGKNPCRKIALLPHTPEEKQIPKETDVIKLILASDPQTDEKDLLIVLLHTLARIDEALRLTWADINFKKKSLIKWTRKTKDWSYKKVMVSINRELHDTIWRMWQNRKQDKWLFYDERTKNRYMHRPKFMKGLCKCAGIVPHFGFHTLRHLMASLMADNSKTSTKTIQIVIGHSAYKTTEIYLHALDGAVENAMDDLSGKFVIKENEKHQKRKETDTMTRHRKIKRVSTKC